MDLGNLPKYWQLIDEEFGKLERLPAPGPSRVVSARAVDESQPAGPRTYMGATRYLTVARDNHEALLALLQHHGVTLWAPWSLRRPIFETSFFAAWLLDPEDGRVRRTRGLRCEILDAAERRSHYGVFKDLPEARKLVEESEEKYSRGSLAYKEEARALGRPFDVVRRKVDVTAELRKLSFVQDQGRFGLLLEATWRQLSGFEHGLGWPLLSAADSTVVAHVPGGVDMHLVIKVESFVNVAKCTYFLLLSALRLFARRHLEPSGR
jgi:hypothetical protein